MSEQFIHFWGKHFLPEDEWEKNILRENIEQNGTGILVDTIRERFIQIVQDYGRQGYRDLNDRLLEHDELREIMVICVAEQALYLLWKEQPETTYLEAHMANKLIVNLNKQTLEKRDSKLADLDAWVAKILWIVFIDSWYLLERLRMPVITWLVGQEFKKQ